LKPRTEQPVKGENPKTLTPWVSRYANHSLKSAE
jgi:hypothetical protein